MEPRSVHRRARDWLAAGVAAAHGFVLLAVVAVPLQAIGRALAALLVRPPEAPSPIDIDPGRWAVLLANTLIVCGVAIVTATLFGLILGILIARTDMPLRAGFAKAAALGACVPMYVTAVFFFSLVPAWRVQGSALACGLFYGLMCAPLSIVVLTAAFRAADRELEDLARLDADPRWVLFRVTLAQAKWAIAAQAVLVFLLVGTDFTIADILFVRTFAEEVYTQYALHRSPDAPVLVALPLLATFVMALTVILRRYRLFGEHSPAEFGRGPRTLALGRWRPAVTVAALLGFVALAGPLAVAVLRRIDSPGKFLATAGALGRELAISTTGAIAGASLVVLFGVGLAWSAVRAGRRRWLVWAAVVLLLALPAPVVGIGLIRLLNQPGLLGRLYDSPVTMVLGYLVRFVALGILLLVPSIQRVPRETELAARMDGSDWLAVQRHVYWPAVLGDAAVAWLVVAMLCFGEVGATVLLAPPGWTPASVRAFTLIHFGVYQDLAVLALASLGCIILPWLLLMYLLRRRLAALWSEG